MCAQCIRDRGQLSGSLHQAERELSGVGTPEYSDRLLKAFSSAEAVLVVNPLTEALVGPSAKRVRVVTAGMDPERCPWPGTEEEGFRVQGSGVRRKAQIFFAGLVEELLKGFHVLHEACGLLWRHRQDFELIATGEPIGQFDEFTRFVGWLSQEELPRHLRAVDMLIMPTIAQEALGRTAVEAMATGRPVLPVASAVCRSRCLTDKLACSASLVIRWTSRKRLEFFSIDRNCAKGSVCRAGCGSCGIIRGTESSSGTTSRC